MTKYELGIVLKPSLTEEQKNASIEKIKGFISKANGEITNVEDWGKKVLAYEIAKVKEGYYLFFKFNGDSETVTKIEYDCRILDEIIRFLTVVDDYVEVEVKRVPRRPQSRDTFNRNRKSENRSDDNKKVKAHTEEAESK